MITRYFNPATKEEVLSNLGKRKEALPVRQTRVKRKPGRPGKKAPQVADHGLTDVHSSPGTAASTSSASKSTEGSLLRRV